MDDELQIPLTNREKKKKPRYSKKYWCYACDASLVSDNEICPVCKTKSKTEQARKRDIKVYE